MPVSQRPDGLVLVDGCAASFASKGIRGNDQTNENNLKLPLVRAAELMSDLRVGSNEIFVRRTYVASTPGFAY